MTEKKVGYQVEHIISNQSNRIDLGILHVDTHFPGGILRIPGQLQYYEFNQYLFENGALTAHTSDGEHISMIGFHAKENNNKYFYLLIDVANRSVIWNSSYPNIALEGYEALERLFDKSLINISSPEENEIRFLVGEIGKALRALPLKEGYSLAEACGILQPYGTDFPQDEQGIHWDPKLFS